MNQNPFERKKPLYTEQEALEEAERMQNIVQANKGEKTYADAANWLKKLNYESRPFDEKEYQSAVEAMVKLFDWDYEDPEYERQEQIKKNLTELKGKKDVLIEAYEYKWNLLSYITRMTEGRIGGGEDKDVEEIKQFGLEIIKELLPKIVQNLRGNNIDDPYVLKALTSLAGSENREESDIGINALVSILDILEKHLLDKNNRKYIYGLELIRDKGGTVEMSKAADMVVRVTEKIKDQPECIELIPFLLKNQFSETVEKAFELIHAQLDRYGLPRDMVDMWEKSSPDLDRAVAQNLYWIIELEKTKPGICYFLYKEFGIADFGRYPKELLLRQMEEVDSLENPYGVILFPRNDWNGAFYQDSFTLKELFDKCEGQFSLRVVECEGKIGLARALIKLNRKYNSAEGKGHKISLAIIGGHGTENSIRFGGDENSNALFTTDLMGRGVQRTSEFFEANPTIILVSCSTGADKGIGQQLSEMMGAKVIAPKVPTNIREIQVGRRKGGKFRFNAKYATEENDIKSVFVGGKQNQ